MQYKCRRRRRQCSTNARSEHKLAVQMYQNSLSPVYNALQTSYNVNTRRFQQVNKTTPQKAEQGLVGEANLQEAKQGPASKAERGRHRGNGEQ